MHAELTHARTYSSADLCALIPEVSPRQLQWWDERKIVTPRQEEHRRIYTVDDAVEIAVIADLRRKRLSLRRIRPALRRLHREISRWLRHASNGDQVYLAITGGATMIDTSPERLLDLMSTSSQPCYVADVSRQLKTLTAEPPKAFRKTA